MRRSILAGPMTIAAILAGQGGVASAQNLPPNNTLYPSITMDRPEHRVLRSRVALERIQQERAARRRAEREILATTPPMQLARAERVASLLNGGRCAEAYRTALDEADHRMAARVAALCGVGSNR